MLKSVLWVFGNLPLLISLVTVGISVAELIGRYLNEGGKEKKLRAIQLIRTNVEQHVALPEFLARHFDALLAMLIDGVVLILNLTRGNDWREKVEEQVEEQVEAAIQAVGVQDATGATAQASIDSRLDELESKLTQR